MAKKESNPRLGKGLSAIFGEDVNSVLEDIQQGKSEVHSDAKFEVAVTEVKPNPCLLYTSQICQEMQILPILRNSEAVVRSSINL